MEVEPGCPAVPITLVSGVAAQLQLPPKSRAMSDSCATQETVSEDPAVAPLGVLVTHLLRHVLSLSVA